MQSWTYFSSYSYCVTQWMECWCLHVYDVSITVQTQHVSARMHGRERCHVRVHDSRPQASLHKVCSREVVQRRQRGRRPRKQHVSDPVHHAHGALCHQHVSFTLMILLLSLSLWFLNINWIYNIATSQLGVKMMDWSSNPDFTDKNHGQHDQEWWLAGKLVCYFR